MSTPVLYEVNLTVDVRIAADYREWLTLHTRDMLALPGVVGARVYEVLDPCDEAGQLCLCVHYTLADEAALAAYLREHAPRMRAAGAARFGDRFHATRRVLRPGADAAEV